MRKLIREICFLRKGERRALYFVLFILCLSAASRIYMAIRPLPAFEPDPVFVQHMEEIQRQIDSALRQEQSAEASAAGRKGTGKWQKQQPGWNEPEKAPLTPVPFNPNTVSYNTLVAMNLSGYVSRNIISYREAGGSFREPGDLEKIYGLSEEDYQALLPYIMVPQQADMAPGPDEWSGGDNRSGPGDQYGPDNLPGPDGWSGSGEQYGQDNRPGSYDRKPSHQERFDTWKDTLFPLELNSADSAGLIAVPGIGPWFAGRIIRYRELLGGYVHPEQLREVYGMDTARFNGIVQYVTADTARIRRINLNNSSFQEIISHPYINREETYAIFRYMDFVDSIRHPENLLMDQIIDRERFMRMAPYLTVKSIKD